MRTRLLILVVAVLVLLLAQVWAQQKGELTNLGYDPCTDPNRVTVLGLNLATDTDSVELIPISGVTRIYICSLKLQGDNSMILYLHFGTGTECAADQYFFSYVKTLGLTPKHLETGGGSSTFALSEEGRAFCIYRDATTALKGHLRYVQE